MTELEAQHLLLRCIQDAPSGRRTQTHLWYAYRRAIGGKGEAARPAFTALFANMFHQGLFTYLLSPDGQPPEAIYDVGLSEAGLELLRTLGS